MKHRQSFPQEPRSETNPQIQVTPNDVKTADRQVCCAVHYRNRNRGLHDHRGPRTVWWPATTEYMPVVTLHADRQWQPCRRGAHDLHKPLASHPRLDCTNIHLHFSGRLPRRTEHDVPLEVLRRQRRRHCCRGVLRHNCCGAARRRTTAAGWQMGSARHSDRRWGHLDRLYLVPRAVRVGVNGYANAPDGLVHSQGRVTVNEEDSDGTGYQTRLSSEPTQNVTVTPTAPTGASVSPTSLTFTDTDWKDVADVHRHLPRRRRSRRRLRSVNHARRHRIRRCHHR